MNIIAMEEHGKDNFTLITIDLFNIKRFIFNLKFLSQSIGKEFYFSLPTFFYSKKSIKGLNR